MHKVRRLVVGACSKNLKCLHPLSGSGLTPINLAHALLHLVEVRQELLPLGLLFFQNLFGCGNAHSSHNVDTLRNTALCRIAVVVDHLLQHLGIGLVALWHNINLVMAGLLELRAYASLFVAYLVKHLGKLGYLLVIVQQFVHRHSCLINLGYNL